MYAVYYFWSKRCEELIEDVINRLPIAIITRSSTIHSVTSCHSFGISYNFIANDFFMFRKIIGYRLSF